MQASRGGENVVREKKARDLVRDRRRLVEVPYTASLSDTMNALVANRVVAVPVAAPPGRRIGAGGSMIVESDKQTGTARKQYIGMVTMLDVVAHIAGDDGDDDLERRMQAPVSSIIGHCLESLSLWTLNSNTSILDCMEVLSKGIHRALVPTESQMENFAGVELVESATSYCMLTQMDLVKFLKAHERELSNILSCKVKELGAVSDIVFGVTDKAILIDTIKSMSRASFNAVPVIESMKANAEDDHTQFVNGKGRRIMGTFSATDLLRGCPVSILQSCLQTNVLDFIRKLSELPLQASGIKNSTKELVTCQGEALLGEVVDKVVNNHVHRVWVVDELGLLHGVISLTDIIWATRVQSMSMSISG